MLDSHNRKPPPPQKKQKKKSQTEECAEAQMLSRPVVAQRRKCFTRFHIGYFISVSTREEMNSVWAAEAAPQPKFYNKEEVD